ncbi:MAG TPA: hypothetical protein VMM17_04365 [Gemmatimonadaceae bacterium]|nr:hypothetical protein [Gemmatimonadaceae bacterium]
MQRPRYWRNRLIAPVAAIVTGATDAAAQAAPAVLQTMSPVEAYATGIEKLTPAERQRLEAWIVRLSSNVAQLVASSACEAAPPRSAGTDLESRIAGDFTGWNGSTVVVLENGQLWQQASFDRVATYAQRPRVTLVSDGRDWRMSVEGVGRAVPVRRVR